MHVLAPTTKSSLLAVTVTPVASAVPLLVTVKVVAADVAPTGTDPKFMVAGEACSTAARPGSVVILKPVYPLAVQVNDTDTPSVSASCGTTRYSTEYGYGVLANGADATEGSGCGLV